MEKAKKRDYPLVQRLTKIGNFKALLQESMRKHSISLIAHPSMSLSWSHSS